MRERHRLSMVSFCQLWLLSANNRLVGGIIMQMSMSIISDDDWVC